MEIFKDVNSIRAFLAQFKNNSIGLVPTMGALHQGHLQLIKTSKKENNVTVATIYVNPTQFNNITDLEKYPRTLDKDIDLLTTAGCDVLFIPSNQEMYAAPSSLSIDFGELDKVLEGQFRPGHFSGVGVVVYRGVLVDLVPTFCRANSGFIKQKAASSGFLLDQYFV